MFGSNKKNQKTITAEKPLAVDHATHSSKISESGFDETKQLFWSTTDRLLFKNLNDIIRTVLESQGFSFNLENILACLDQTSIGCRATVDNMEETNHIEQYSPALCFNLPKKSKVGVSLQKFYDEIAVYESEILRYRKNKPQKKQKSNFEDQSKEELMKTAASLQQENIDLRQQSEKLARQVVKLKDSTSNMYQSIEVAKESLPEQIREAKVSQVLLEDRQIVLRMNRKTLHIPTMKLSSIPQKGQKCLLYMVGGIVKDAFFYGSKTVDVQKEMATVLCNQDGKIKIIDEQRRTWILTAKNSWEKEMNAELKRDDKLQLGFFEGKILSYQKISRDVSHHYEIKVQENITREQIKVNFIEGKAVDSKKLQEAS